MVHFRFVEGGQNFAHRERGGGVFGEEALNVDAADAIFVFSAKVRVDALAGGALRDALGALGVGEQRDDELLYELRL